jgi:hypothetical protein
VEEGAMKARVLGAALRGIIFGVGLYLALAQLFGLASGARIFRYQGF